MSHPLRLHARVGAAGLPTWPNYAGNPELVGASPSGTVTVYVDPSLGPAGLQNAQDLLNDADRVVAANNAIFGTPGGAVNVIVWALNGVTDGTGGADHAGCDYNAGNNIEIDASLGSPPRVSALFEAELSECSMSGNLCGVSTGEALSRWCAATTSNNALADFATAPQWFSDGMPDFVNQTDPTDQSVDSTGCGMAFISWLLSKGSTLSQIAQGLVALGSGGTFAALYQNLTGNATDPWPTFQADVQALAGGVTSDDPFGGAGTPSASAQPSPSLSPTATP